MIRYGYITLLAALTFISGCASPMQKVLARYPHWEKFAQHMTLERNSNEIGLVWETFPDIHNAIHRDIWNALWEKRQIADGFGTICDYYGFHLVMQSTMDDHGRVALFCKPSTHLVVSGRYDMAFALYGGDKSATIGSIRVLVKHLLAVSDYEAFVVDDCNQIPHKTFQKDNPSVPFSDFLGAKGITIVPAQILKKNERADSDDSAYSECSVFVYRPCGGDVFRYEVRCKNGRIVGVERFLLGDDIGDCWYIQ